MKVLLVNPPTESDIKRVLGIAGPPLGLAYLASIARRRGHEVEILDASAEGLTFEEVKVRIKRSYPDVIGITATTPMIYDAYKVAKISKDVNENSITLIGGPHVTFLPEFTLRECPYLDIIVRGEGEETFRDLMDKLPLVLRDRDIRTLKEILGISYREGNRIIHNPPRPLIEDLDSIPIPSFDLLPWDLYKAGEYRYGVIMTSRGCPFNCIFCSSSLQFGKRWRGHSVGRVLEEIRLLREGFGIKEIEFLDDTFTLNRKRAQQIARELVKEGLDISWTASSRVNTFDTETAKALRESGAHTIYFGIESGSQRILNFIGKGITINQAIKAVKTAVRVGLKVLGSFILGFPTERNEDIKRTIRLANKLDLDYAQFTIATPYPGTRLWYYTLRNKLLTTLNWRKYTTTQVVMRNLYLTADQIKKALLWAYLSFYLRPKYVIRDFLERKGFLIRKAIPAAVRSIIRGSGKPTIYEEEMRRVEELSPILLKESPV